MLSLIVCIDIHFLTNFLYFRLIKSTHPQAQQRFSTKTTDEKWRGNRFRFVSFFHCLNNLLNKTVNDFYSKLKQQPNSIHYIRTIVKLFRFNHCVVYSSVCVESDIYISKSHEIHKSLVTFATLSSFLRYCESSAHQFFVIVVLLNVDDDFHLCCIDMKMTKKQQTSAKMTKPNLWRTQIKHKTKDEKPFKNTTETKK